MTQKYGGGCATWLQRFGNTDLSLPQLIQIEFKSFLMILLRHFVT